jgi:hypothetical protein
MQKHHLKMQLILREMKVRKLPTTWITKQEKQRRAKEIETIFSKTLYT